jgi:hypothetical protein
LATKYKEIEGMPDFPMDIQTKETQIWIKDFMWRVTEELMEAYEAKVNGEEEHYLEELSDALHFYMEIFVLLDYKPKALKSDDFLKTLIHSFIMDQIIQPFEVSNKIFWCVFHLGIAANFLRNKKWKVTQVFVDEKQFYQELVEGLTHLLTLIIDAGVDSKIGLLNLYYKKFQVNQFRQRSKY